MQKFSLCPTNLCPTITGHIHTCRFPSGAMIKHFTFTGSPMTVLNDKRCINVPDKVSINNSSSVPKDCQNDTVSLKIYKYNRSHETKSTFAGFNGKIKSNEGNNISKFEISPCVLQCNYIIRTTP